VRLATLACLLALVALGCGHLGGDLELACPRGTTLHEEPLERWCATPDGTRHGPMWGLYPNGRVRYYATARLGRVDGVWMGWHPNGAQSLEARYEDGRLVGTFRTWDKAGHLLYGGSHDREGEMDGLWTRWWPNGRVRLTWQMRHGHQDGAVAAFYESGARRMEGWRRDGRPDGRWAWWDEQGHVAWQCRYADGAVVEGTCAPDTLRADRRGPELADPMRTARPGDDPQELVAPNR